jgi:hypothetical protein
MFVVQVMTAPFVVILPAVMLVITGGEAFAQFVVLGVTV